jgi:hypothetical protein
VRTPREERFAWEDQVEWGQWILHQKRVTFQLKKHEPEANPKGPSPAVGNYK